MGGSHIGSRIAIVCLAAAGIVCLSASTVRAQKVEILVTPIEGRALDGNKNLKSKLRTALVDAARRRGAIVKRGRATMQDVARSIGCTLGSLDCRQQILSSMLVDEVVGCTVSRRGTMLVARISHLTADGRIRHTSVELRGKGTAARVKALRRQGARVLRGNAASTTPTLDVPVSADPPVASEPTVAPKSEPAVEPEPKPVLRTQPERTSSPAPTPERKAPEPVATASTDEPRTSPGRSQQSDDGGFSFAAVERRSWIALGAGVGLTAVAVVVLGSANGKQDEIDAAPTSTVADLDRLRDLESSARWRYRASNGLFIAGGALVVAGAVLIYLDGRDGYDPAFTVAPTPDGGLGVAFTFAGSL